MLRTSEVRALAFAADRDQRTIIRWLAGLPVVHPASIEAAASSLGIVRTPAVLAIASAAPLVAQAATGKLIA
jgi:hypothetical protein